MIHWCVISLVYGPLICNSIDLYSLDLYFIASVTGTTNHGQRHFCTACGTDLTIVYDSQPDCVWPAAGTLEDSELLSKADWFLGRSWKPIWDMVILEDLGKLSGTWWYMMCCHQDPMGIWFLLGKWFTFMALIKSGRWNICNLYTQIEFIGIPPMMEPRHFYNLPIIFLSEFSWSNVGVVWEWGSHHGDPNRFHAKRHAARASGSERWFLDFPTASLHPNWIPDWLRYRVIHICCSMMQRWYQLPDDDLPRLKYAG